jgi:hypothetical protein
VDADDNGLALALTLVIGVWSVTARVLRLIRRDHASFSRPIHVDAPFAEQVVADPVDVGVPPAVPLVASD